MSKKNSTPWFGPKRFGFGIRPIAWQGWAIVFGLPVVMILIAAWINGTL